MFKQLMPVVLYI